MWLAFTRAWWQSIAAWCLGRRGTSWVLWMARFGSLLSVCFMTG